MTDTAYLPNRLNEYTTYTYNISLFMVAPENIGLLDKTINTTQSKLIADNASVARYNISDLEQSFVVGHNTVRSAFGNRFTMTITEPNGVTLLDTIKQSARSLGIRNHMRAAYLLRIEFNGRLNDNTPKKFPLVFYYPVTIPTLEFKVDEGGTTYNVSAIENSTNAYSYLNNVMKDQVTILSQTVGEFLQQFTDIANQTARDAIKFSSDVLYNDTFSIELDDSIKGWGDWQFQALSEKEILGGVNVISVDAGGVKQLQVTVSNGSNITDMIGMILSQTAEYKNILLNNDASKTMRESPDQDTSTQIDKLPIFHKIITDVEYGQYDVLRGEYTKNITYRVIPYIVADEVISSNAYTTGIADTRIQSSRVQNLVANNLLRKRYDYIYTGRNTEVMSLDMKFNYAYYYITPYGGGRFGDPAVQAPVESKDRTSVLARYVIENRSNVSALEDKRTSLASYVQTETNGVLGQAASTALAAVESALSASVTTYRSSVSEYESALLTDSNMAPENVSDLLRFAQDVINDDDTAKSDDGIAGGNLKFAAVKSNLENPADMIEIELGVRGDPYWLGAPTSFYNSALQDDDTIANFERGNNMFFLKANLPRTEEDADGRRKPRPEYSISGVYSVRSVISQYRNGQFTQYLKAVKDQLTNTVVAMDELDKASNSSRSIDNATTGLISVDRAQAAEDAYRAVSGTGSIQ